MVDRGGDAKASQRLHCGGCEGAALSARGQFIAVLLAALLLSTLRGCVNPAESV